MELSFSTNDANMLSAETWTLYDTADAEECHTRVTGFDNPPELSVGEIGTGAAGGAVTVVNSRIAENGLSPPEFFALTLQ